MSAHVHLLDDDIGILQLLTKLCKNLNLSVTSDHDPVAALPRIKDLQPDLLIVDLKLGSMSGLEVIQKVRNLSPKTRIIMVTGYSSIDTAVEAMRLGAFDYITKPFKINELQQTIHQALKSSHQDVVRQEEVKTPKAKISSQAHILEQSEAMRKILATLRKIAPLNTRLLLIGEVGVGKGYLVKYLHEHSSRKSAPCKTVYVSAFSPESLEAELFGHENQPGTSIFSRAKGGTVHLAEIHRMPMRVQSRLLAFLNEDSLEEYQAQLVCSSQVPLEPLVKSDEFREDLIYKIGIVPIQVPSLIERPEDIKSFAEYFLRVCSGGERTPQWQLEPFAMELLQRYPWPGNISELSNVIEHAYAMADDFLIKAENLPSKLHRIDTASHQTPTAPGDTAHLSIPLGRPLHEFVEQQQKWYIEQTLKYFQDSREKTAASLGISVATLYRKLDLKAKGKTTL